MADTCPVCMAHLEPNLAACPLCGFKLLGSTQKFKPISAPGPLEVAADSPVSQAVLRVIRGPQIGMSYKLGSARATVGRDPKCGIFLNDMTVSRTHASIELVDGCHVISDEHSYNGVWVNNKSIEAKALELGDHIQIGTFLLKYDAEQA